MPAPMATAVVGIRLPPRGDRLSGRVCDDAAGSETVKPGFFDRGTGRLQGVAPITRITVTKEAPAVPARVTR